MDQVLPRLSGPATPVHDLHRRFQENFRPPPSPAPAIPTSFDSRTGNAANHHSSEEILMSHRNLSPAILTTAVLSVTGAVSASAASPEFLEPDVTVLYTLTPEAPGGSFGFVAERLGDINGDGITEFIIGASQDSTAAAFGGRAFVYSGSDGSLLHTVSGGFLEFLGTAVAGLGDVDGDGIPDYAVGAPGLPPQFGAWPGRVQVFSGADHSLVQETVSTPGSRYGQDIHGAGDVTGDGRPDLIVGAPFDDSGAVNAGRVHLISGPDGSEVWATNGLAAGDAFGGGVSGIGDFDLDGIPDQLVGAFNAGPTQGGEAAVLSGADGSPLLSLAPLPTAGQFGQFFSHDVGDVDGDGISDFYVGDFADTAKGPTTGRAYVYSGATGGPLWIFDGEHADDGFGIGRGADDVNGDGHADLFLAAYRSDDGAGNAGKAYLFSGRDGGAIRSYTGTIENHQLGFDAVPLGDVNGDGFGDYLLTGVDIAHVVAGTDSSLEGRIASLCQLIESIPEEAFKAPAAQRKVTLCGKLSALGAQVAAGAGSGAVHQLDDDIQAKMDGALGGAVEDDWILDPYWQNFLKPWLDGLIRLAAGG
jgi:hypothetical protein